MRSSGFTVVGTALSLLPVAALLTTGTDLAIPHIYASIGMIGSVIFGGIGAGITESHYWSSKTGGANLLLATFFSAMSGTLVLTGLAGSPGDALLHVASWASLSFATIGGLFLMAPKR
jgi:hypothetical protein